MTLDLPRIEVVACPVSGVIGLEIANGGAETSIFSAPFRWTSLDFCAIAVSQSKIVAIEPSRQEIALVDAPSGRVLSRIRATKVTSDRCALIENRTKLILFGSHPTLEVYDVRDLALVARYDDFHAGSGKLFRNEDYFKINDDRDRIYHSEDHKRAYLELAKDGPFRFPISNIVETGGGSIVAAVVEEELINSPNRASVYRVYKIDYKSERVSALAEYRPPSKSRSPFSVKIEVDGSACLCVPGEQPREILPPQFAARSDAPKFAHLDTSGPAAKLRLQADGRFATWLSRISVKNIGVAGWDHAACCNALSQVHRLLRNDFESLIWQWRLEFGFTVGERKYDEGEFYGELVSRNLRVGDWLKLVIEEYLSQVSRSPRSSLFSYAKSVNTGEFPVVPAMGPAMRALVLLDDSEIGIIDRLWDLIDLEDETYISTVLADYAHKYGWSSKKSVRVAVRWLQAEKRGPEGFENLGLFLDASRFLSAEEFAELICSVICPSGDYDVEDWQFADFLNRFEMDEYGDRVRQAINSIVGRKINLRYWE